MNVYRILIVSLMLISCALAISFFILAPDEVPVHWNIHGEVDRVGSKYEQLLMPAMTLILGLSSLIRSYRSEKRGDLQKSRLSLLLTLWMILVFLALSTYFQIKALQSDGKLLDVMPSAALDQRVLAWIIAGGLLLLALVMLRLQRNRYMGLRTKWSLANDRVWALSQRFSSGAAIFSAILLTVLSFLIQAEKLPFLIVGVILFWTLSSVAASYYFYKNQ